jgi:hypothetical protein
MRLGFSNITHAVTKGLYLNCVEKHRTGDTFVPDCELLLLKSCLRFVGSVDLVSDPQSFSPVTETHNMDENKKNERNRGSVKRCSSEMIVHRKYFEIQCFFSRLTHTS